MNREEMVFYPGEEGSVKKISCIPIKELEESLFYYIETTSTSTRGFCVRIIYFKTTTH